MNETRLEHLVLQALTHEQGGIEIYRTAIECAVNRDLKKEWAEYLEQTERHVAALIDVCDALGIDPDEQAPGRKVVEHLGASLVRAMKMALDEGDPEAAQLVACDCVVLAETKDHANWQLLSACAKALSGEEGAMLAEAVREVEDEEDEHLYHTKGWCRELSLQWLGLKAELPPAEERRDVRSAVGAARIERERSAAAKA